MMLAVAVSMSVFARNSSPFPLPTWPYIAVV